ncbi:MAG: NAD(P)/FAD-dependent oxidoreductase [Moraxella sp.]|uniref:NAD(P)/FAD-dependent oxidoreductase n=1 Tax=Moraxella sp. TaxID=479 RepID=UPI0026DBFACA|nr:NAD(P)/FAD-dependent oxidoreductase [Moraxella sp.]MDO4449694.1 NAD(P)/FAD-dependent oxidoreductase [Moraxella sp.]
MQSSHFDVIIIGAGASGLFCAINAGKRGKSVLVIDHANKAGKKILMSGGGRCNFINMTVSHQNFVGDNPDFTRSALSKFTPHHFMDYIYKHGIAFHEKAHGQLFCDDSSKDILNMLLTECNDNGVQISLNTHIQNIDKNNNLFHLKTKKDHKETTLTATSLVVATGGLSIPTLGASGFGYDIARKFGHKIVPTHASLVPMTFTDNVGEMIKHLSGISIDVIVSNNKISFELPMLFTHRGLSGPAILQLSNYWEIGESIHIDLLPNLNIGKFLIGYKKDNPKKLIRTALMPYFAKKLLTALEAHFWEKDKDTELANIKDKTLLEIGASLNDWQVKPSGTEGYRTAEVTRGGVSTDEVSSKTFESKHCQNLYFIGEVLDVAGWLGGYNFHWAWASGFACANALP